MSTKYIFDKSRKPPPKIPNIGNLWQLKKKQPKLSYYFPRVCFFENEKLTVVLPRPSSLPQVKSLGTIRKFTTKKNTIENRKRADRFKASKTTKFRKAILFVEKWIKKSKTFEFAGKKLMEKLIFESASEKVRNVNLIAVIGFYLSKLATIAAAHKIKFSVENLKVPEDYFKMLKLPHSFDEKVILDNLVKETSKLIDKSIDEEKSTEARLLQASSKFVLANEIDYEPPSPTIENSQISDSESTCLDIDKMTDLDSIDAEIWERKVWTEKEIDNLLLSSDSEEEVKKKDLVKCSETKLVRETEES